MSELDPLPSASPPPEARIVHFLDGMRLSVEMATTLSEEIRGHTATLEAGYPASKNRSTVVRLILAVWSVIDVTHRFRELLQQAPRLKKKDREVQSFLRSTETVESLRHYVQHLRTEIAELPEQSTPVWGVIAWVSVNDPTRSFTVFTGTPHPKVSVYTIAVDTHRWRFAQDLILSVNNVLVDVPDVVARIEGMSPLIERWAGEAGCPPPQDPVSMVQFVLAPLTPSDGSTLPSTPPKAT